MKKIGVTQRVSYIEANKERRDCLDQRWTSLVLKLGFMIVPLPNIQSDSVSLLLDALSLTAIILSGGNSLEDTAPERDTFEKELINQAMARKLPLLGVCRGMQMLNVHLGGSLSAVHGQAGIRHTLKISPEFQYDSVNSYHEWGIASTDLAPDLKAFAWDPENYVEAYQHTTQKVAGIMWHPEREAPFQPQDLVLMKKFLL